MWTCPERVVRDNRLVAYKGERMTEAEAKRRGLLPVTVVEPDVVEPAEAVEATEAVEEKPKRRRKRKQADDDGYTGQQD